MLGINKNIFYVGVKDEPTGAYNNAYLVKGEKTALIDTVSKELSHFYINNVEEIMPIGDIDYLVCNHTEPDKSGAVKKILELNPDIEVVGTIAAIKNLKEITNMTFKEHIAKEGAVLDLGGGTELQFCITPNLNWPDTMITYEKKSKALFTCDMFSTYYDYDSMAHNDNLKLFRSMLKEYYDAHFLSFKEFVLTALEKISALDIKLICPGYGSMAGTYVQNMIRDYTTWSTEEERGKKRVTIFYSSRYGYTAQMAEVIAQTLYDNGVDIQMFHKPTQLAIDALNSADAVVMGSHTIDKNAGEDVRIAICSLNPVSIKNKPYFVFGSYGWSGEGIQFVDGALANLKMKRFEKPFMSLMAMSEEKEKELVEYTKKFADYLKK